MYRLLIFFILISSKAFSQNLCFSYSVNLNHKKEIFPGVPIDLKVKMEITYQPPGFYFLETKLVEDQSNGVKLRPSSYTLFLADMNKSIIYTIDADSEIVRCDFIKSDSLIPLSSKEKIMDMECNKFTLSSNDKVVIFTSKSLSSIVNPAIKTKGNILLNGIVKIIKMNGENPHTYTFMESSNCNKNFTKIIQKAEKYNSKPQNIVSLLSN